MADRTIAPVSDIFLIWTAVIAALTTQLILALLGLGIGILAVGGGEPGTVAWAGFLWWAASGIFAAGVGGMAIAALGEDLAEARKAALALIAWATAILIVAVVTALAAGGGTSLFAALGGPMPEMLGSLPEGGATDDMRRGIAMVAVASVIAMLIGAVAQVAGAIASPGIGVRTAKRA